MLVRRHGLVTRLHSILGIDGAMVRRDNGEAVILLPPINWGARLEAPGSAWNILGDVRDRTYAELVAMPVENLLPKPLGLSWAEAAALPTAGLTAHRALFTRAHLLRGEGCTLTAYLIAILEVTDQATFARYLAQSPATVQAFGGDYVARGGENEVLEGAAPGGRVVVVKFPSLEDARAWYNSPQYLEIRPLREASSRGLFLLTEGLGST